MGTVVVLRKDPRGTGEESSPWGQAPPRLGLGEDRAADWSGPTELNRRALPLPAKKGLTALATTVRGADRLFCPVSFGALGSRTPGEPAGIGTRPGVPFTANRGIGYEGSGRPPERDWIGLSDAVDAIAVRLTRQLAGKVESSANVSSPTVFCPR